MFLSLILYRFPWNHTFTRQAHRFYERYNARYTRLRFFTQFRILWHMWYLISILTLGILIGPVHFWVRLRPKRDASESWWGGWDVAPAHCATLKSTHQTRKHPIIVRYTDAAFAKQVLPSLRKEWRRNLSPDRMLGGVSECVWSGNCETPPPKICVTLENVQNAGPLNYYINATPERYVFSVTLSIWGWVIQKS